MIKNTLCLYLLLFELLVGCSTRMSSSGTRNRVLMDSWYIGNNGFISNDSVLFFGISNRIKQQLFIFGSPVSNESVDGFDDFPRFSSYHIKPVPSRGIIISSNGSLPDKEEVFSSMATRADADYILISASNDIDETELYGPIRILGLELPLTLISEYADSIKSESLQIQFNIPIYQLSEDRIDFKEIGMIVTEEIDLSVQSDGSIIIISEAVGKNDWDGHL